MNWSQIAEDPICQQPCDVLIKILESESSVNMQATLSLLLTIQVAFAVGFQNRKVLQDSENITLDYEVSDGIFLFKMSARANEKTQLGLVFSDRVKALRLIKYDWFIKLFHRINREMVSSPILMGQLWILSKVWSEKCFVFYLLYRRG